MRQARPISKWLGTVAMVALPLAGGCQGYDWGLHHFFDPSKNIRQTEPMQVNPIFESLGPTDPTEFLLPGAEKPKPDDLKYFETDYVIGPTDILRVSVLDLLAEGLETVLERQVSESGYVDLPLLANPLKVAGLTNLQATELIKEAYSPNVLKDPNVSVRVVLPRQSTFSIMGAVLRAGTFNILRNDFTLLEALALAGDVSQVNIDWIYVIRRKREPGGKAGGTGELPPLPELPEEAPPAVPANGGPATTAPSGDGQQKDPLKELEDAIPPAGGAVYTEPMPVQLAETGTEPSGAGPQEPAAADPSANAPDETPGGRQTRWVYADGKWIEVDAPAAADATKPATPVQEVKAPEDPYGWGDYDLGKSARIIAVNLPRLKAGDPSMNVVIRPNDIVNIPPLQVGEFYVMGEVQRPGVYSLTGRRVTVKMAVAAAGNIAPLGWPNNSVLIRRVGRDQEQRQQIKLADIIAGKEPDVFLKPNDIVAVGSYWAAPFMAIWRNAFRMTYGFGFIYDRNYSERDFEIPLFLPSYKFRGQP
ncbi:MAG TPA: polysaccharide biosynthesis/export family protein [Phycisphaerae bacterium]|nr:polysaccharide biosynthesis/export family protein [Phycisphaerae bacterium]